MSIWNFGQFLEKSIFCQLLLKFKYEIFFCTHVTHITVVIFHTAKLVSTESSLLKWRFHFPILRFLVQNHLVLLKDRFLRKYFQKEQTPVAFSSQK